MFRMVLLVPVCALLLGGCATIARDSARKEGMADCAAQGLRYLELSEEAREGLILSTGTVRYLCVDPSHPDYAQAVEPEA